MRWIRRLLILLAIMLLVAAGGIGWLYWASHQVPEFYKSAAAEAEPQRQEERREAAARLVSETKQVVDRIQENAAWTYEITPAELNAWIVEELPQLLKGEWPQELAAPRVAFEQDRLLIGAMVDTRVWKGVAALSLRPALEAPRTLWFEVESFKIGSLTMPIERLIAEVPEFQDNPYLRRDAKTGRYSLKIPLEMEEAKTLSLETLEVTPERLRVTGR